MNTNPNQKGMSLAEVMVGMLILGIALFGALSYTSVSLTSTRHSMDKEFATQKAIAMLEELKSLVQIESDSASLLDAYDDGTVFNDILTTDRTVTNPAAGVSGNRRMSGGNWKFLRQVSVGMLPNTNDPAVRLVKVSVFINQDDNGDGRPDSLAEVASVIRSLGGTYATAQVYDVYVLAVENVPGWWVYMANLIPFVQNALQELEARNPGLVYRLHWITELAYGRDILYRPQINDTVDSLQPINNVYFYPGMMPTGQAVDYYYPVNNFRSHILVDSTDTNGYDAAANPYPYALADMYNHAMRYPDELALFQQRVASGNEADDAPTLRILLERMYQHPEQYRNAIIMNLHGELFPFPPLRNHSDPAKSPATYPSIRVVTHPERLRYPDSATSVTLRVYSYRMDPDNTTAATNLDWLGQNTGGVVPIQVILKGVTWSPTSGSTDIVAVVGGTDQDGVAGSDAYQVVNATTTASTTEMYYSAANVAGDTIISLYNSPLKTPEVLVSGSDYAGLNTNSRLYGLEYVPAAAEDFTSGTPTPFSINLASTHTIASGLCSSGACEPNTARWIITVPESVLPGGTGASGTLRVETRIDSTTSGTLTDTPPNLSATYVWWGTDTWLFGDGTSANPPNLPLTEQFQIQGDPRHNPYADLKMPHQGSGLASADRLGLGYNRYFDDFENTTCNASGSAGWNGYTYTVSTLSYGVKNDGTTGNDSWKAWGSYSVEIDMHRIYQVLRTVLTRARIVWTTMTGYSYYYVGIGGEIGYDSANGFTNSIPVNTKLTTGATGSTYEQSILPGTGVGVKYIKENVSGTYWWGINWLGELYPDSVYSGTSGWAATGNLPTGSGSGYFVRTLRNNITVNRPRCTTLLNVGRRTGPEGSTTFYWTGTASSTFHHQPSTGTGDLQAGGIELASRYNYPLSNGMAIDRPFDYNVNQTTDNPDHFLQPTYGAVYTAGVLSQFYNHSVQTTSEGSALLSLADTSNNVAFVAVNGISATGLSGTSFIARYSALSLIHSFFAAGLYNPSASYANHIEQVPRVTITSPNASTSLDNPSTVTVGWTREWRRWDGQTYTPSYGTGYSESTALSYTVMYSSDNGTTWAYMQDDSAAVPGVRPTNSSLLVSTGSATPTYTWSTPSSTFPMGNYLIRVEAYRDTLPLHYAYHQYRAFIRRP